MYNDFSVFMGFASKVGYEIYFKLFYLLRFFLS
jgi:hypothetical protein